MPLSPANETEVSRFSRSSSSSQGFPLRSCVEPRHESNDASSDVKLTLTSDHCVGALQSRYGLSDAGSLSFIHFERCLHDLDYLVLLARLLMRLSLANFSS